jgi:hypothetical protein
MESMEKAVAGSVLQGQRPGYEGNRDHGHGNYGQSLQLCDQHVGIKLAIVLYESHIFIGKI